jgi:hypothetical protein
MEDGILKKKNILFAVFRQRIPANVKSAMIVDANGDGFNELIVTLTDRVVRTYQWHHTGDIISMQPHGHLMPKNKWEFASQVLTNKNFVGSFV